MRASSASGKWAILLTVVLMTFMSTLDSSIVNVALPAMQRELSVSASDIQWVSSVYLLVCCAAVLIFGRAGDLFGKVRLFQAGVALFTAGSLLCGLSGSLPALIAARCVQGLGAASATANNMGIVTEVFPVEQRGRALGIVSTFVSLGMMCGPTVGGMLIAVYPWESIFLINVPIGVASFVVGLRTLPRDGRRERGGAREVRAMGSLAAAADAPARPSFDLAGALLLTPAIFMVFYAVTALAEGASAPLVGLLALGIALAACFVAVERRAASPLIRLDVFANPVFDINLATMFLCFFAVGGTELILPFFLQDACGFPSSAAGLALTAIPLAMAVMGPLGGALSDRIGCAWPCLVGLVVYAAGIALVGGLTERAPLAQIVGLMAFMAAGTGLFQSPNNSLVMGSVDRAHLGFAGSLVSLVRYMGMSAGVTGCTSLLYGRMSEAAGYPVRAYVEGRPDLFLAGFGFAFAVCAALCALGAALTVAGMVLRRRHRCQE